MYLPASIGTLGNLSKAGMIRRAAKNQWAIHRNDYQKTKDMHVYSCRSFLIFNKPYQVRNGQHAIAHETQIHMDTYQINYDWNFRS